MYKGVDEPLNVAICAAGEIWGGVEEFICTFSRELKNKGLNFVVILFNRGLLAKRLNENGIQVEVLNTGFKYDLTSIFKIKKILSNHRVDIMHIHGYKAMVLGGAASALLGIRIIKTEHGRQEPSRGFGRFKMSLNLYLDRLFSKHLLDGIVFVSKDIQYFFSKSYLKIKQYVVYNAIEPIEVDETKRIEMDNGYFKMGVIGRISEVKGHMFLLKAMRRLKHLEKIRLYVFGEGPLEKECKDYCFTNGLYERVYFMGFKRNIEDYLCRLDLLIMPSLHEGLPYALLEAMYLRVPVVASEVGGLKEVIDDGQDGILLPPQDEEALSYAIERLYNNKELRDAIAHKAYNKICSEFMAMDMMEKYINVYHEVLQVASMSQ
jgi:glycosyltransferase involved in cell wall biosynthesis